MTHLRGVISILLVPLASLAQTPSPPPDWIDEFPSVTEVAHAAFEEMKVTAARKNFDNTGDDDAIAINLAGTFVVLRQIMLLKYNEEPPMKKDREEKLKKLVASYLEAELTIGRGWAGRRGYITGAPPSGLGCRDEACYRRWFLLHLNASSGRAEYRERVLNRLFPCGTLAKELNELRQKHATTVPYMPSPAATLRIEKELAGIAPVGCTVHGGDSRKNGLCDAWTPPSPAPTAGPIASAPGVAASTAPAALSGAFRSSASGCLIMELTNVRMAPGGGLKVSIAPKTATPGATVQFRVVRADAKAKPQAEPVWEGEATIQSDSDPAAALHVIVARDEPLTPDEARAFLLVDAISTRSRGPVQCEQPLRTWLPRQLPPDAPVPVGLHGPYGGGRLDGPVRGSGGEIVRPGAGLDAAVLATVDVVLGRTATNEGGFVVLQNRRRPNSYYATAPVAGPAPGTGAGYVTEQDYTYSVIRALDGSCEDPASFVVASFVHTHPVQTWGLTQRNDNFTMIDFKSAFDWRRLGGFNFGPYKISNAFEGIYMINARNRCVQSFTAENQDDKKYDEDRLDPDELQRRARPVGATCP
jgi:hypothetical protein